MADCLCDRDLHRSVGMSDLSSLLAVGFRFPGDDSLPSGLADGSFLKDWCASWEDACIGESFDEKIVSECAEVFARADHAAMRREYSRLFLAPGADVPIWPYESAFRHDAAGKDDVPNLFRTRATVDVEQQMADAGVRPKHVRTEPCDLCATEFEFLSYLYARWGEAVRVACSDSDAGCEGGGPSEWGRRIAAFSDEHVLKWIPQFFSQVRKQSRIPEYRILAKLGECYVSELSSDARRFSS